MHGYSALSLRCVNQETNKTTNSMSQYSSMERVYFTTKSELSYNDISFINLNDNNVSIITNRHYCHRW